MSKVFEIDFRKLVLALLPKPFRKPKFGGLLQALVAPFQSLHQRLLTFKAEAKIETRINNQTMVLEHFVNRYMDTQGIYIQNLIPNYIYRLEETVPITQYRYTLNETAPAQKYRHQLADYQTERDFIVYVPASINLTSKKQEALTAFINKYKLPDKTYQVKII